MSDVTGTGEPGSVVIPSPLSTDRPQPLDAPGDMAGKWVKVGAQAAGGNGEFTYGDGYFGGDSGVWRQT